MKKLSAPLIITVLFFTIKCFGGNHPTLLTGNKPLGNPSVFPRDTTKKSLRSDTAKDADDSADADVRSYAIGITFGSDQSFHGIQSSTKTPYMEPNFTYTAPSGFYVLMSVQDILAKDSGGFDALDINPGWDITLGDNTTLNFNVSHYIFRAKTPLTIKSDLSDEVATYIDQSIGNTDGKFTIAYDYYKKASVEKTPGDIVFTPDLSHTFEIDFSKKSSLSIIPEGDIDFGTRNAYSHYQSDKGDTVEYVLNKKGQEVKERKTPNNSSFGTLDYTLTLTLDYKIGCFEIEPALNYNKSLYQVAGVPTTPLKYGTVAFIYTIEKKKK
jgi:hypothetical protein